MLSKTDSRGITAYTYDRLNRLINVTEPSGKTTTYTFDASGNRKTQTVVLGTDTTVTTYTHDSQNHLTGTAEQLNGVTTETVIYTYDNNGNQLTKTSTAYIAGIPQTAVTEQTNTYDLFNQLISTVTSTGVTVINTYNGDGRRVGKAVNGSLTRYLYEYDKVVLEANYLGDQTGRNVYGINLLTRQVGGDTLIYMYNGHADVTALLDTAGNIAATYYYDAFGKILDQTGSVSNNILYAGYQYDSETGLYYLNARMYDPITARFMQEDTYAGEYNDPLSLNLYTYCKNEPIRYSDPTGHSTLDDYDYQKKAEERKTRSSSTQDDYAYQNQTRIAKDRQSKSVDDYYYNKNASDALLKAQTLEQQRPTNIPSLAAPAKENTLTATGMFINMPWGELSSPGQIHHAVVNFLSQQPYLGLSKNVSIKTDNFNGFIDLVRLPTNEIWEVKPISYLVLDITTSLTTIANHDAMIGQLTNYVDKYGGKRGEPLGVYMNIPIDAYAVGELSGQGYYANIYSLSPGEVYYTFGRYEDKEEAPAPVYYTAEEYAAKKAKEKVQAQVPVPAEEPVPVFNFNTYNPDPISITMTGRIPITGEKYTPIEQFMYDVSNSIKDSYNEFHDSIFGENGGGGGHF